MRANLIKGGRGGEKDEQEESHQRNGCISHCFNPP